MKRRLFISTTVLTVCFLFFSHCTSRKPVDLNINEVEKKVDVIIDGKLFTSYIYPDNISDFLTGIHFSKFYLNLKSNL